MKSPFDPLELRNNIGPVFMAGMPGTEIDPPTESLIRDRRLGGLILFSRNIKNPVQVARLCLQLQELSMSYQGRPLFLAIDQEGGRVARLQSPFTSFPGNTAIAGSADPQGSAREFARTTALEMNLVGLNMNMAPVLDVSPGKLEKHLVGRTFGEDPDLVAGLGQEMVKGLQRDGIMAVAKHFPGLGKSPLDPHRELPVISLDDEEMRTVHLPPFKAAIEAGVSSVMSSHAVYPRLDKKFPATLSRRILSDLLRKSLSFKGLVITDDLEMGAIAKGWGISEAASSAFEAGADILLICKDQNSVADAMRLLEERVKDKRIPLSRLRESLNRIERAKSLFFSRQKPLSLERVKRYFGL